MDFKIVAIFENFFGVSEPVYDVLINDCRHLLVRKSTYERFNKGELMLVKTGSDYTFSTTTGTYTPLTEIVF